MVKGVILMFFPLQIPNILDKEFKKTILYKEYVDSTITNHIMCIWSMKSYQTLDKPINNVILPDACIDLIVDFSSKNIIFTATSKATINMPLVNDIDYLGIRFRPSVFYNIYGVDSSTIIGNQIPYAQIERYRVLNDILEINNYDERLQFLLNYINFVIEPKQIDDFVKYVNDIDKIKKVKYVQEIADYLNYSVRQTNRVFQLKCGVSAKTFLNIIRLHDTLKTLIFESKDMLYHVDILGFYDQSHFTKEIKKYCGVSPVELINMYDGMS